MSSHSKTPYVTPSMEFSSGGGVVHGVAGCSSRHLRSTPKRLAARPLQRTSPPQWGSTRFRPLICTYAPWGIRVVSLPKTRKIPTRKISPLFFVRRARLQRIVLCPHSCRRGPARVLRGMRRLLFGRARAWPTCRLQRHQGRHTNKSSRLNKLRGLYFSGSKAPRPHSVLLSRLELERGARHLHLGICQCHRSQSLPQHLLPCRPPWVYTMSVPCAVCTPARAALHDSNTAV